MQNETSTQKTIRVILADSVTRTVTQHDIAPTLAEYYRLLRCSMIEAIYPDGMGENYGFCDEEGLYNNHPGGVLIAGFGGGTYPISGSVLFLQSDDEGDSTSCSLSVEEVRRKVRFVEFVKE